MVTFDWTAADIYQVFRTVMDYLGGLAEGLPPSWLGSVSMDTAWCKTCESEDISKFIYTAKGLASQVGLNLELDYKSGRGRIQAVHNGRCCRVCQHHL